jgi:hypothetical protein
LGYAQNLTFSVGQDYSLKGCSSAEPFSAYLGSIKVKAYPFKITKRLFNKVWGLGREPVNLFHEKAIPLIFHLIFFIN